MESPVATLAVAAVTLAVTAAVIHFSPHGWSGLRAPGPWWMAAGASLPPALYTLTTSPRSDNPALWSAFGGGAALLAGLMGLLVALFLPVSWRWWNYLLLGAAPWAMAGVVYLVTVKSGPARR